MQGTSGSRSNMSCQIAISNKRTGLPARRAKGAYRSLESVPSEYRIIQPVGWRVHSPSGAPADFAGLPGSSARGQVKGNRHRNAVQAVNGQRLAPTVSFQSNRMKRFIVDAEKASFRIQKQTLFRRTRHVFSQAGLLTRFHRSGPFSIPRSMVMALAPPHSSGPVGDSHSVPYSPVLPDRSNRHL